MNAEHTPQCVICDQPDHAMRACQPKAMTTRIENLKREKATLLEAARGLMQIENEKWPEYVRRQFAEMRKVIAQAEERP